MSKQLNGFSKLSTEPQGSETLTLFKRVKSYHNKITRALEQIRISNDIDVNMEIICASYESAEWQQIGQELMHLGQQVQNDGLPDELSNTLELWLELISMIYEALDLAEKFEERQSSRTFKSKGSIRQKRDVKRSSPICIWKREQRYMDCICCVLQKAQLTSASDPTPTAGSPYELRPSNDRDHYTSFHTRLSTGISEDYDTSTSVV